jgi:hypothetical protein
MDDTTDIKLSTPVEAHGKTVDTLTFRKPMGRDIRECGSPQYRSVDESAPTLMRIETNAGAMAKYISRLGNIPPSSVDRLSAADWLSCAGAVLGFFMTPESSPATPSTDIGNLPDSSQT